MYSANKVCLIPLLFFWNQMSFKLDYSTKFNELQKSLSRYSKETRGIIVMVLTKMPSLHQDLPQKWGLAKLQLRPKARENMVMFPLYRCKNDKTR